MPSISLWGLPPINYGNPVGQGAPWSVGPGMRSLIKTIQGAKAPMPGTSAPSTGTPGKKPPSGAVQMPGYPPGYLLGVAGAIWDPNGNKIGMNPAPGYPPGYSLGAQGGIYDPSGHLVGNIAQGGYQDPDPSQQGYGQQPPPGYPVQYDPYGNGYDAYGNLVTSAAQAGYGYPQPAYGYASQPQYAPQVSSVDPRYGYDTSRFASAEEAAASGAYFYSGGFFDDVVSTVKDVFKSSELKDGAIIAGTLLGGPEAGVLAGKVIDASRGDQSAHHDVAQAKADPSKADIVHAATKGAQQAAVATSIAGGNPSYDDAVAWLGHQS